jgi:hypothetical protein
VTGAFADGIAKVYDETGMPPTYALVGPTGAARLTKVLDSAGRPLFPQLGPANASGTGTGPNEFGNIFGLRPIVSPAVTTAAIWLGNSAAFEAYERPLPLMQQVEPSVLGLQVAVATMAAFYRPRTKSGQLGPVQLGP